MGFRMLLHNIYKKILLHPGSLLDLFQLCLLTMYPKGFQDACTQFLPGVSSKYRCLINNKTKVLSLIVKLSSILAKTYPDLSFETNIVEIH